MYIWSRSHPETASTVRPSWRRALRCFDPTTHPLIFPLFIKVPIIPKKVCIISKKPPRGTCTRLSVVLHERPQKQSAQLRSACARCNNARVKQAKSNDLLVGLARMHAWPSVGFSFLARLLGKSRFAGGLLGPEDLGRPVPDALRNNLEGGLGGVSDAVHSVSNAPHISTCRLHPTVSLNLPPVPK